MQPAPTEVLTNSRRPTLKALNLVFTPVLPSSIPRYDQTVAHFGVGKQVIPANLRLGDPSSGRHGDGWTYLVTPEGDGYFYHAQFRIITYNDIRNASIERRLLEANRSLTELASLKDIQIAHCEAFIDVTVETSLTYQAKYYFVDHGSRHPFWVHETRADDLGLPTFESLDDLKNALLPEFWNHIEYFPTHQIIDETYEYELVAILRHGDTDNMTSPGSTFPFSAEECRYHVQTLEGFIASGCASSCRTATFARLWATITRVRHINRYGLRGSRLDRTQGLVEFKNEQRPTYTHQTLNFFFLNLPRSQFERLTELWNGRIVFQRHWHTYFEQQRTEWLRHAVLSSAVFVTGVILIVVDGSRPLTVASIYFASTSVVGALTLFERHSKARLSNASEISSWISSIESPQSGLFPLAIKFSLPQATAIYSGLLLLSAVLALVLEGYEDRADPGILLLTMLGPTSLLLLLNVFL